MYNRYSLAHQILNASYQNVAVEGNIVMQYCLVLRSNNIAIKKLIQNNAIITCIFFYCCIGLSTSIIFFDVFILQ